MYTMPPRHTPCLCSQIATTHGIAARMNGVGKVELPTAIQTYSLLTRRAAATTFNRCWEMFLKFFLKGFCSTERNTTASMHALMNVRADTTSWENVWFVFNTRIGRAILHGH